MSEMCKFGRAAILTLALVAAMAACKKSSPTSPSPPPGGGTNPPPGGSTNTTTMTIDGSGRLTPNDITVAVGSRVTFINNHNGNHEMNSDPHPAHSDCPPINDVGFITPGQTRVTGNLTVARTCGVHDHGEPSNQNLKGIIRIQ